LKKRYISVYKHFYKNNFEYLSIYYLLNRLFWVNYINNKTKKHWPLYSP